MDRIKIDRAFVTKLSESGGPRIAEMITQLGHKLELRVLAEGLEDALAWQSLQAMGCDEGQGYYIARPMAFEPLIEWIAQWPQRCPELAPWTQA
jgi:EAL domain-containing protein (putative c-di-GMP-specific phosphodiesterase class I)